MVDIKHLRVPNAPLFAQGKKVAGPEEMQAIMRYSREVQATFNTMQTAIIELQQLVTTLQNAS